MRNETNQNNSPCLRMAQDPDAIPFAGSDTQETRCWKGASGFHVYGAEQQSSRDVPHDSGQSRHPLSATRVGARSPGCVPAMVEEAGPEKGDRSKYRRFPSIRTVLRGASGHWLEREHKTHVSILRLEKESTERDTELPKDAAPGAAVNP